MLKLKKTIEEKLIRVKHWY